MSLLVAVGGEKIFYLGSGEKVEAASKYMNFKVNIYTEILPEEMLLTNPGRAGGHGLTLWTTFLQKAPAMGHIKNGAS
ncbi:hypothetical protein RRG08_020817 [Elysia crispata]|uniref:Uncharacterized protein n=1 Tax=Elysia crispata TaxID=231223 RepID=A0AAE0XW31_9GAST|nr:hypothetical protein RRG08_020817 [Elysia crispata]